MSMLVESARKMFHTLFQLSVSLEEQGFWNGEESIGDTVVQTIYGLAAYLGHADGTVEPREVELINAITNDSMSHDECSRVIYGLHTLMPNFLHELPAFVRTAIAFDIVNGTSRAALMVKGLEAIGICFIAVDNDVTIEESAVLAAYVNEMKHRLESVGVPTTVETEN